MAADTKEHLYEWEITAGNNFPKDATNIGANFADNLQTIQAVVRYLYSADTIASATTTDLGSKEARFLTVTGTTTITGFGTVSAGIEKVLTFAGALTLTYNATSLILPGAANITTAAGDRAVFVSLGSGNWAFVSYTPISGFAPLGSTSMANGTVGAPGLPFASDTDTGLFRVGANILGFSAGGTEIARFGASQSRISAVTDLVFTSTGTISLTSGGSDDITIATTSGAQSGDIHIGPGSGSGLGGSTNITAGAGTGGGGDAGHVNLTTPTAADPARKGNVNFVNTTGATLRLSGRRGSLCVVDAGGSPSISSGGGTGVAIAGSNNGFKITLGTAPGTTDIVVTFSTAFANKPMVVCQYQAAAPIALTCPPDDLSATGFTITPASAMSAGDEIDVWVIGREAT